MQIQFMLLALFFGALAIVIKLTSRLQRSWVERNLYMGDLRALSGVAFRRNINPPSIIVSRLEERGFMGKTARGSCRVTLKGWIAVLVRHTSARRPETKHE